MRRVFQPMSATAISLVWLVLVVAPEVGAIPLPDLVAVLSRGAVVAPVMSSTVKASAAPALMVTVTLVTGAALAAYQTSPSFTVPCATFAARTQWLTAESVMPLTEARVDVGLRSLMVATRRSPVVVTVPVEAFRDRTAVVSAAPNDWATPTAALAGDVRAAERVPPAHATAMKRSAEPTTADAHPFGRARCGLTRQTRGW